MSEAALATCQLRGEADWLPRAAAHTERAERFPRFTLDAESRERLREILGASVTASFVPGLQVLCRSHLKGHGRRRPEDADVAASVHTAEQFLEAWRHLDAGRRPYLAVIGRDAQLVQRLDELVPALERVVRAQALWRTPSRGRRQKVDRHILLVGVARLLEAVGVRATKTTTPGKMGKFGRVATIVCQALEVPLPDDPFRVFKAAIDEHRRLIHADTPRADFPNGSGRAS